MTDIIDELFYSCLDVSLLDLGKATEQNKKQKKIMEVLDALQEKGATEEAEYLWEAITDSNFDIGQSCFALGLRLGIRLMVTVMGEEKSVR